MGSNFNFKNFGNDPADSAGRPPAGGFPLARQGSIYSLTFDEFQTTLGGMGKDFGSMNMDELLKNIWTAEDSHNFVSSAGCASGNGYLQRQGSITLPRTLSHKTVDEVWRTMSKDGGSGSGGFGVPQRQPTLGEITIEEFLMRAGVVREETTPLPIPADNLMFEFQQPAQSVGNLPINVNTGNRHIPKPQPPTPVQLPQQQQILPKQPVLPYGSSTMGIPTSNTLSVHGDAGLGMVGIGANSATVAAGSPALSSDGFGKNNGDMSSVSPVPYLYNGGSRGRRTATMEKAVERRQRRMIKNRESAARSRARKQAYTTELEAEVAKLKEEQEVLQKKQAEMLEMQKIQVLEMMKHQNPAKRRCLKRTHTGPW